MMVKPRYSLITPGYRRALMRLPPLWMAGMVLLGSLSADTGEQVLQVGPEGTVAPYRKIGPAVAQALELTAQGTATVVELLPGSYRESLTVRVDPEKAYAPLTLRALNPGESVILGSERVDGWRVGPRGTFENRLPTDKIPADGNLMMFVQDVRLVAVNTLKQVEPGKFFVDRDSGRIHMLPPRNAVVADGNVEVSTATLAGGWRFDYPGKLQIEGLVFRRFARAPGSGEGGSTTLRVEGAHTVHILAAEVAHSSGIGMHVQNCGAVVIASSSFNRNGLAGLVVEDCASIQLTGVEAQFNGWRHRVVGRSFPERAYALRLSRIPEIAAFGLRIADNSVHGMRISGNDSLRMREGFVGGNRGHGLSWSGLNFAAAALQVAGNGGDGLVTAGNTRLSASILTHNGEGADHAQWRMLSADAEILRWADNIFSTADSAGALIAIPAQPLRAGRVEAHRNLYYQPGETGPHPFTIAGIPVTFDAWQVLTGQDLDSCFDDPRFDEAEAYHFALRPGSPWYRKRDWPVREVEAGETQRLREAVLK